MAKFVIQRQATVWYEVEVEADTAEIALEFAMEDEAIWNADAVEIVGTLEFGSGDRDYWVQNG